MLSNKKYKMLVKIFFFKYKFEECVSAFQCTQCSNFSCSVTVRAPTPTPSVWNLSYKFSVLS